MRDVAAGIHSVREAIDRIPPAVLGDDDQPILSDVRAALDVVIARTGAVVVAGPSGAGKSHVANILAGTAFSEEGELRPTTRAPVQTDVDGVAIIDLPAPEFTEQACGDSTAYTVFVVSPSRYADASAHGAWSAGDEDRSIIVLNRVEGAQGEQATLVASVTELYGRKPVVIEEGVSDPAAARAEIFGRLDRLNDPITEVVIATVVEGMRRLAASITERAPEITSVAAAVGQYGTDQEPMAVLPILETWPATRDEMVHVVRRTILSADDTVVRTSGGDLAALLVSSMGPWDETRLMHDLDAWVDACVEEYVTALKGFWRKGATEALVRTSGWRVALNADVTIPSRLARKLRRVSHITDAQGATVRRLLLAAVAERKAVWEEALAQVGAYKPGELTAAAARMAGMLSRG